MMPSDASDESGEAHNGEIYQARTTAWDPCPRVARLTMRGAGLIGCPTLDAFRTIEHKNASARTNLSHFSTKRSTAKPGMASSPGHPNPKAFRPWLQTARRAQAKPLNCGWILLSNADTILTIYTSHYVARPTCHHTRRIGEIGKPQQPTVDTKSPQAPGRTSRGSSEMNAGEPWAEASAFNFRLWGKPWHTRYWTTFTATKNDGSP